MSWSLWSNAMLQPSNERFYPSFFLERLVNWKTTNCKFHLYYIYLFSWPRNRQRFCFERYALRVTWQSTLFLFNLSKKGRCSFSLHEKAKFWQLFRLYWAAGCSLVVRKNLLNVLGSSLISSWPGCWQWNQAKSDAASVLPRAGDAYSTTWK